MKTLVIIIFVALYFSYPTHAQQAGVAINSTGSAADASAMLDVNSTDKGVLVPRMTETEKNAIVNPARGLLIFQIDNAPGFRYFDGFAWLSLSTGDNLGNHIASDSVNMSGKKITNLALCTHNLDAANKEYVDNVVSAGGSSGANPKMLSNESSATMNFGDAMRYCRNLSEAGYNDWYLPSFDELTYIVSKGGATINNENSSNYLWLADRPTTGGSSVWEYFQVIRLSNGTMTIAQGSGMYHARCIRQ